MTPGSWAAPSAKPRHENREYMDATAEKFVDFAHGLEWEALPTATAHAAKRSLVDAIGCLYGGYDNECLVAARRLAATQPVGGGATVIGTDVHTTPDLAALVNGAAVRYLDYSDDYFGGTGELGPHPSDNIAGILAAAEWARQGGQAVLLGIVIAYEAVGRIVDAANMRGRKRTWDYPVLHAIGTALGSARVLGLDAEQTRNALGLAVTPNNALLATRLGHLSNWKAFAGPNASRNGLFATLLAREGVSGPHEPFEGDGGLFQHLDQTWDIGTLGAPFRVEQTFFKAIPVRYTTQLPVIMAIDLRQRVAIDEIERLDIFINKRHVVTREHHGAHWDPTTRETADHSLPYLVAAALIDGAITPETFTPARYRDPDVLRLTGAVHLSEDPESTELFPREFKLRFDVTLKSGEVVSMEGRNPKGHPRNPMSDDELDSKFIEQTAPKLGTDATRELLAALWRIEEFEDVRELLALMAIRSV